MARRVNLPDGSYFTVPDQISDEVALKKARELYPDAFPGVVEQAVQTVKEIPKGFGLGIAQTIGGLGALTYGGARAIVPSLKPYEETGFGEGILETQEYLAPKYEGYAGQIGSGLGQFGSLLGPGLLLKGAGATKLGTTVPFGQAAGMGAEQQRSLILEAKAQGVDVSPEQEAVALFGGAVTGLSELAPIRGLLKSLPKNLPDDYQLTVANRLRRAAATGSKEAVQEAGANIAQEAIALGVYNPNQKIGESIFDEMVVGGGVGSIAQAGIDLFLGPSFKKRAELAQQKKDELKRMEEVDKQKEEAVAEDANKINEFVDEQRKKEGPVEDPTPPEPLALGYSDFTQVQEDELSPTQNFIGNITKDELPKFTGKNDYVKELDRRRRAAGKPKLEEYSIEDIAESYDENDVGIFEAELDRIIAGKLKQRDPEIDLDTEISIDDINDAAIARDIDPGSEKFNNFVRRTVGTSNLQNLSNLKKIAVYEGIQNSDGDLGKEFSTNATRFSDSQYKKALNSIESKTEKGVALNEKDALSTIKEASKLKFDSDAKSLLNTARERGDISDVRTEFFEVDYGTPERPSKVRYKTRLEAEQARARSRNPNATIKERTDVKFGANTQNVQQFPDGSTITKVTFKKRETGKDVIKDKGFKIFTGDSSAQQAVFKTRQEAQKEKKIVETNNKKAVTTKKKQIEQIEKDIAQGQATILSQTRGGKKLSRSDQKQKDQILNKEKAGKEKVKELQQEIESLKEKVTIRSTGVAPVTAEGFIVKSARGKQLGKFKSRTEAEQSILSKYSDRKLREYSKDLLVSSKPFQRLARKELARREGRIFNVPEDVVTSRVGVTAVQGDPEETARVKARIDKEIKDAEEANLINIRQKEQIKELDEKLKEPLRKLGLNNVRLEIINSIAQDGKVMNGEYHRGIITIALDAKDPMRTLRHEGIHALRGLGAIKEAEWNILSKKANNEWIQKYLIDVRGADGRSLYDLYMDQYSNLSDARRMELIQEEAVAEAFADFSGKEKPKATAGEKAPSGFVKNIMYRLKKMFEAIKNAFSSTGAKKSKDVYTTADDIFQKIDNGEYVAQNPYRATRKDIRQAEAYFQENGIDPYLSEGPIGVQVETTPQFSIKVPQEGDPIDEGTGLPLNKDGTVSLYYPTTAERAREINRTKVISPEPGQNAIYFTNESYGWKVMGGMNNMTQETDGSVVYIKVNPKILEIDGEYEGGRKDFFVPTQEGEYFKSKMMKLQTLTAKRKGAGAAIDPEFSFNRNIERMQNSLDEFNAMNFQEKRARTKEAKQNILRDHNIKTFLKSNGKLDKTNKRDKEDLDKLGVEVANDGVSSLGLSLAAAQQLNNKLTSCPNSAICESLCLGDTSGGNLMFGGVMREGDEVNTSFRAAGRLSQYLKTEALVINPEDTIILLNNQITNFKKRVAKQNKTPAVRLNVLSDFPRKFFLPLMNNHPDVEFYDYSKLDADPLAPNHHITYSSTGVMQRVDGEVVGGNAHKLHNWSTMRRRLMNGDNIAMAFSNKSKLPSFVVDEETGRKFEVFNGDVYDARFLDPKREDGIGLIIGLKNKDGTSTNKNAAQRSNGFFVHYDPSQDGDTVTILDQNKFPKEVKEIKFTKTTRQVEDKIDRAISNANAVKQYSIQINPAIQDRINKTTIRRQPKPVSDRINDYIGITPSDQGYLQDLTGKFRQEFLNKYEGIERLSKKAAERFGKAELFADQSAIAAALMSDRASGVFSQVMREGIPVYKKGYVHVEVSETNSQEKQSGKKGFLEVLQPLARFDDPDIFQKFQYYAGAKRSERLAKEGRERLFTAEDRNNIKEIERLYRDENGNSVFRKVYDDYQAFNKKLVDFMVATGIVDQEAGRKFSENYDYIPFYRQMQGETTSGPQIFQSLTGISGPKQLKGGEDKIDDFFENSIKNIRSTIEAGMKNVATQRIVRDLKRLSSSGPVGKLIEPAAFNTLETPDIITIREKNDKGKVVTRKYRVADPLLVEAMKAMDAPQNTMLVEFLSKPAQFLREMVTRDPAFIGASVLRESLSTWVTTGRKGIIPLVTNAKTFAGIATEMDPTYKKLVNAGIGSGYDFKGDIDANAQMFEKEIQEKAGRVSKIQKTVMPLTKAWQMLDKYSTAADLAPRETVYKKVLEETGNEAEAVYQALEVINFSRKGRGAFVRTLSSLIPFFNARLQGLDLLYRAGFGQMASEYAVNQQKAFWIRSSFILASTAAYVSLVKDTEEYENASDEERDNYWILPGAGNLKIPIPFEIGVLFKVLPERIYDSYFGEGTPQDLRDAIKRNLAGTLMFNPIPQAILPLAEVGMNYSIFLGRDIVGLGAQDLATKFQYNEGTSLVAREAANALGVSPMKLDYLIRGYTGNMGTYLINLIDSVIRQEDDPQKPAWRLDQIPVLKRFLTSDKGAGVINDYYELRDAVREVTRSMNSLEEQGLVEEYQQYIQENGKLIAIKPQVLSINRQLVYLRDQKRQIQASRMDPTAKRQAIDAIRQAEQRATSITKYLKKLVDE